MPGAQEQRRRLIVEAVREHGCVDVGDLAGSLDVAAETVRRDLHALEAHGLVRRTHGGALPVDKPHFETQVMRRSGQLAREKRQIAAACIDELTGWESIFLDQGSTALAIAERLAATEGPLTVVTSSLQAAIVLSARARTEVMFLGGRLRGRALATVGASATSMLAELRPDVAVMTASGISLERGVSTSDAETAELKRVAMKSSGRALFAADHTKFGASSFCHYAAVDDFAVIVTDAGLTTSVAAKYRAQGLRLVRATS